MHDDERPAPVLRIQVPSAIYHLNCPRAIVTGTCTEAAEMRLSQGEPNTENDLTGETLPPEEQTIMLFYVCERCGAHIVIDVKPWR